LAVEVIRHHVDKVQILGYLRNVVSVKEKYISLNSLIARKTKRLTPGVRLSFLKELDISGNPIELSPETCLHRGVVNIFFTSIFLHFYILRNILDARYYVALFEFLSLLKCDNNYPAAIASKLAGTAADKINFG